MKKTLLFLLFSVGVGLHAQTVLTLDSCRAMALRNNKQLAIAAANRDKAYWEHEAARTNYLPKIEFMGGYMRTSKELSILSDDQKSSLNNLGTNIATPLGQQLDGFMGSAEFQQMAQAILQSNPDLAPLVQQLPGQVQQSLGQVAGALNGVGQQITDAFRTDSRNVTAGTEVIASLNHLAGFFVSKQALKFSFFRSVTFLNFGTTSFNTVRVVSFRRSGRASNSVTASGTSKKYYNIPGGWTFASDIFCRSCSNNSADFHPFGDVAWVVQFIYDSSG